MKKIVLSILVIILLVTLGGCWSRKEPKDLAIVTSIVYDTLDDGTCKIYIEVLAPEIATNSDSTGRSNIIYIGKGDTILEALVDAHKSIDKILVGAHNRVRFITVRAAEKGIKNHLDYFLRANPTDEKPYLVVADVDDPMEIYKAQLGQADMVGSYVESIALSLPEASSSVYFPTTMEFIRDYYSEGKQPACVVLKLVDNEVEELDENYSEGDPDKPTEKIMVFEGLAAFRDGRLVGLLSTKEAEVFNILNNYVKRLYLYLDVGKEQVVATTRDIKSNIETEYSNGQPIVNIKIECKLKISLNETSVDYSVPDTIKGLEQSFNRKIEKDIETAIANVQSGVQSDIFGIGRVFHNEHPKEWRNIKDQWDSKYFPDAKINVEVKSSINLEGEIREPMEWFYDKTI